MSSVSFVKVKHEEKGVFHAVKKAMELTEWKSHVKGNNIFIKINGISDHLVPGQCTSPWVIDSVFSELKRELPNASLKMGDANLAAAEQLNRAAKLWGFQDLAKKYNVEFVNLSNDELVETDVNGKVLKKLLIPKTLLETECIVNLPVAKTHCLTGITCCLKNHWGMIPRFRHKYHLVVNQAIADINRFFIKTVFNVVDATICMEGNAPRTGIPKVTDTIFAGGDRVAIDAAVAKFMGFDPYDIEHLKTSEEAGIGKRDYELVGDDFETFQFKHPKANKQPIFFWEMSLRKVPMLNSLLFDTKIFSLLAWIARQYNSIWWYNLYGKKYAKTIIYNSWYGNEFKELWDRTRGKGKL